MTALSCVPINAGKMHKIIGTKNNFNKVGPVIAVSVNKCKLSVTEVETYNAAHLLMMDLASFLSLQFSQENMT